MLKNLVRVVMIFGAITTVVWAGPPATQPAKELTLDLSNKVTLKMVLIPAGKFLMGSPETEKWRLSNEVQHGVTISKSFYMASTPVTQAQWQTVMGNNPSLFDGDNLPVEQVSWDDAVAFCKKLSAKEGKTCRLPTEAQWEYACRAGTTTAYNTGDDEKALAEAGWYRGNSDDKPHPVGQKKANAWGLYDMHGNVLQWCSDWYGGYYKKEAATDPTGANTGSDRVLRGGFWKGNTWDCRAAVRARSFPGTRDDRYGFRVVVDAD
ncbi:MAG: formylglycine-generating enzyme family protein [Planctomycetota bacterium]|nr:formylglycine-generating enzyme family protein [Planctomycetota bacterium]